MEVGRIHSKDEIRQESLARRRRQPDSEALSDRIVARCVALSENQSARTVMFYVDVGAEVRTRTALETALTSDQRIVVPYCVEGELSLYHLESMTELAQGQYGILEPSATQRSRPEKSVPLEEVDVILVPGVAFDRRGARLGRGKGYYDRLLTSARPETALIGLAFECQVFDELPVEAHDVRMHRVVTEAAVYGF